jgi:hypothetical protein
MDYRKQNNFQIPSKKQTTSYGIEEEMSLQSIQFATTLNTYLNERIDSEYQEND